MLSLESTISEEVNTLAKDMIRSYKKLGIVAEGLLGPIPIGETFLVYRVETLHKTYIIEAREGSHPVDIQKVIEGREGKSFDELLIPYLKPTDIEILLTK